MGPAGARAGIPSRLIDQNLGIYSGSVLDESFATVVEHVRRLEEFSSAALMVEDGSCVYSANARMWERRLSSASQQMAVAILAIESGYRYATAQRPFLFPKECGGEQLEFHRFSSPAQLADHLQRMVPGVISNWKKFYQERQRPIEGRRGSFRLSLSVSKYGSERIGAIFLSYVEYEF